MFLPSTALVDDSFLCNETMTTWWPLFFLCIFVFIWLVARRCRCTYFHFYFSYVRVFTWINKCTCATCTGSISLPEGKKISPLLVYSLYISLHGIQTHIDTHFWSMVWPIFHGEVVVLCHFACHRKTSLSFGVCSILLMENISELFKNCQK